MSAFDKYTVEIDISVSELETVLGEAWVPWAYDICDTDNGIEVTVRPDYLGPDDEPKVTLDVPRGLLHMAYSRFGASVDNWDAVAKGLFVQYAAFGEERYC